jgi:hypothetical protein
VPHRDPDEPSGSETQDANPVRGPDFFAGREYAPRLASKAGTALPQNSDIMELNSPPLPQQFFGVHWSFVRQ